MQLSTKMRLLGAAFFLVSIPLTPAAAQQRERFTILEENDSLWFNSDKHYTQGLRLSYLAPEVMPESFGDEVFDGVSWLLPWMSGDGARTRRYAFLFGQSIFTPKDLDLNPPDPSERPYAGWLYAGTSLLQESGGRMLDHVELQLGVVGPAALGRLVQNEWHQLIGTTEAKGWSSQLPNEPGLVLEVERKWRLGLLGEPSFGLDVVPELGAVAGNVFTYGKVGALLRFGSNLGADYGPVRITPALSGTDYVDSTALDRGLGFYFFVGAQGRAVWRNIFLDGSSFRSSPSVDKKAFVADLQAGFSLFWSDTLRLDVMAMRRSPEFEGQNSPDVLGTVGLSILW